MYPALIWPLQLPGGARALGAWGDVVAFLRGLPQWQALVVIVVGSALAALLIQVGGDRLIRRLTARIEGELDDVVLETLHPPLYVTAILVGAYLARDALTIDEQLAVQLDAAILSVLTVLWAFTLVRLGRRASRELTEDIQREKSVVPIFQNVWTALVLGLAAFLLMTFWEVSITPLLASAGIIGIVVGLAARDTIANFFGSIALYFDGTYRVGDYVVIESGERGRVEDISIRSTVIRTRDDVLVTVPNSKLNSAVLINESAPRRRYRIRCPVGVAYGTDLDRAEEVLLEAAGSVDLVLEKPAPRARVRSFGDSAVNFELLCWVRDPVLRGRGTHLVNKAIYERFATADIAIPFPQRDLHLYDGDEAHLPEVMRGEAVGDD